MKKIGVIGIPGRWSSESLADEVEKRTGSRLLVSMDQLRLDLEAGEVFCGEINLTQLDGVIVKKIAPEYNPGIVDRVEILKMLEAAGVRVFSKAGSIGALLSRLTCTVNLRLGGIPMPPTTITESSTEALRALKEYKEAVLKPLFTSKARGMKVVQYSDSAKAEIDDFQAAGNQTIYLQKKMSLPGKDLGVVFLGGKYLATYARVGKKGAWNTTTNSGGKYESCEPSAEILALAAKAQKLFDMDFTCVDVAETENGPVVFEVSAFGGFRGLQMANGLDAAALYVNYVLETLS